MVDIADPQLSLDPIRVFGLGVGTPIAQSFLNRLLGFKPMSEMGVLLDDVLVADYMAKHEMKALGDVLTHLSSLEGDAAKQLAQRMRLFARKPYGRAIFDASIPPLDLSSRAIIIRTHTLQLPLSHKFIINNDCNSIFHLFVFTLSKFKTRCQD